MGCAGKHGEPGSWQPDEVAGHSPAEKAEHLDGVFGPNDVRVADDQQGWDLQGGEPCWREGHAGAVELVHLGDE